MIRQVTTRQRQGLDSQLEFSCRGHASQKAEEHFFDQLLIVLDLRGQFDQVIRGITQRFCQRGSIDEFHDRAKGNTAGPFTLTGTFPDRSSEVV